MRTIEGLNQRLTMTRFAAELHLQCRSGVSPKMSDPEVRSPLVEGLLDLGQGVLTSNGRALSMREVALVRNIFQSSMNYGPIRVADTAVGAQGRPYTFGYTIRVPGGGAISDRTLAHECTHVWQYQTQGTRYLSNSAFHQIMDRSAYNVVLVPGQAFSRYTAENQAVIIEAYYVDSLRSPTAPGTVTTYDPSVSADVPVGWSRLPDVVNCLRQLRAARPMTAIERYEERLGPQPLPGMPDSNRPNPQIVPFLRIDF